MSWADVTGWLMSEAEHRFGPRDTRWFFTGIEFADCPCPIIYYPGNRPLHVAIRLTLAAANDPNAAYFELAHEVVHLLAPTERMNGSARATANVLEEGMASRFQQDIADQMNLNQFVTWPSYVAAMGHYDALRAIDPDAVRRIRAAYPELRDLTDVGLMGIVPGAPAQLAQALTATFVR